MPAEPQIRNPFEMVVMLVASAWDDGLAMLARRRGTANPAQPVSVRRIETADVWQALREAAGDLAAARDDILFVGLIYPVAGLVVARLALGYDLLPLVFPLASGFALLGPLAAIGLYELSRRREQGLPARWVDALAVLMTPAIGSIVGLGAVLLALFLAWLVAAWAIYAVTLGPSPPTSTGAFLRDVFSTPAGWAMMVVGVAVGMLFAAAAFAISVVSFPLLLDRNVSIGQAIATSVRAVRTNPGPMTLWAAIIAGALALGSAPALVGLILAMPLLGHATWRLYRRVIADPNGSDG
jgi:uncharacterized membrane protein